MKKRTLNDIYVDALTAVTVLALCFGVILGARAFAGPKTSPPKVAECHNFEGDIIPCSWLAPQWDDEARRKVCHADGCVWRYFENFCYANYPRQCGECVCEDSMGTNTGVRTDTSTVTSVYAPIDGGIR
jgi:hypothetical protein